MTKQEEILEGIDRIIQHWSPLTSTSANWAPLYGGVTVGQDTQLYLHSQGVVLKVERELPTYKPMTSVTIDDGSNTPRTEHYLIHTTVEDMLKAGYSATEPLI